MKARDVLLRFRRCVMLWRRELEGIPPQRALFPQKRKGAERIAALQGHRVIEDVQYSHLLLGSSGRDLTNALASTPSACAATLKRDRLMPTHVASRKALPTRPRRRLDRGRL